MSSFTSTWGYKGATLSGVQAEARTLGAGRGVGVKPTTAGRAAENEGPRTYSVYTMDTAEGELGYVGMTSRPAEMRLREQLRDERKQDLKRGIVYSDLTYEEARGLEQLLYENNGGNAVLRNAINPVSPANPSADIYRFFGWQASERLGIDLEG